MILLANSFGTDLRCLRRFLASVLLPRGVDAGPLSSVPFAWKEKAARRCSDAFEWLWTTHLTLRWEQFLVVLIGVQPAKRIAVGQDKTPKQSHDKTPKQSHVKTARQSHGKTPKQIRVKTLRRWKCFHKDQQLAVTAINLYEMLNTILAVTSNLTKWIVCDVWGIISLSQSSAWTQASDAWRQ